MNATKAVAKRNPEKNIVYFITHGFITNQRNDELSVLLTQLVEQCTGAATALVLALITAIINEWEVTKINGIETEFSNYFSYR